MLDVLDRIWSAVLDTLNSKDSICWIRWIVYGVVY